MEVTFCLYGRRSEWIYKKREEKRRDEAKDEILDEELKETWCNKGEKTIYTDL